MSVYMYINTRTYNETLKWNIFWMMFSDTQSNKSTVDKLYQISKKKDRPSKQYLQMYMITSVRPIAHHTLSQMQSNKGS